MDEVGFRIFLKRGGRSARAADRVIKFVTEYAEYLLGIDRDLDRAAPEDLESYVAWIENDSKNRAKKNLWALPIHMRRADGKTCLRTASGSH